MTVKMLQAWNVYPKDQIVTTLSGAEETRLIGIGFATYDLDGVDNDSLDFYVRGKRNPVTGGDIFSGPNSTLELAPGVNTVGGGGGGSSLVQLLATGTPLKLSWLGNSVISAGQRMMDRLAVLSSGRLTTVKNAGHPGIDLAGVMTTIAADIDPTADIVAIGEGSNAAYNLYATGTEYTLMVTVINYIKGLGKIPLVLASPPRNQSAAIVKMTSRYPFSEQLAALDTGSLFVDPYYDWRGPDGGYLPGYSDDATHPGSARQELYDMAARRIWESLNPFFDGGKRTPYMEVLSDNNNAGYSGLDNSAQFVPYGNALLQDAAVAVSTTWLTTDAAKTALSVVSAAPFRGNKLVIDFNAGVSSTPVRVSRTFMNSSAANKPAIGDVLQARAVVECTKAINANFTVSLKSPSGFAEVTLFSSSGVLAPEMFSALATVAGNANSVTTIGVQIVKAANITLTATGSGTNLTVSAVSTGIVPIGCTIAGTGIPVGTKILSQTSGTPGGVGVYVTDQATTASAAAVEVLATGVVSISNADLYNLTKLRTTQYGYA